MLIASIPRRKPTIFPIAANLPLYIFFDSGISSPETIYNIAPAGKDNAILIVTLEIFPTIPPINAPIPVVNPDIIVNKIAFLLLIPPFFNGNAIDIPSGTS